jgi:hypothetical protein
MGRKPKSRPPDASKELQLRVDIEQRFCTKDDLATAKGDLNERIKDAKNWIWYSIIPLVGLIVTLVVLLINSLT